jgi:aspartate aminotransferase-like enzyme
LTTSGAVKQAMLHDLGSRDSAFIELTRKIRRRLLHLGGVDDETYEAVLMQGSGTFAVESVISSVVPRDGKLLVRHQRRVWPAHGGDRPNACDRNGNNSFAGSAAH